MKDTRLSARYIFAFQESLGARLALLLSFPTHLNPRPKTNPSLIPITLRFGNETKLTSMHFFQYCALYWMFWPLLIFCINVVWFLITYSTRGRSWAVCRSHRQSSEYVPMVCRREQPAVGQKMVSVRTGNKHRILFLTIISKKWDRLAMHHFVPLLDWLSVGDHVTWRLSTTAGVPARRNLYSSLLYQWRGHGISTS